MVLGSCWKTSIGNFLMLIIDVPLRKGTKDVDRAMNNRNYLNLTM